MKNIKSITPLIILLFCGCSSSKITTFWKQKNTAPQYFNKIMVIGIMRENDRAMQEKMENHLVGDLKNIGFTALSSLNEYGPNAFKKVILQLQ